MWNANRTRLGTFVLTAVALLAGPTSAPAEKSPFDWAFVRLDYARKEKVKQLKQYCTRVHYLAGQARDDNVLIKFFDVNLKCFDLAQSGTPSQEFNKKTSEFQRAFNEYYIQNWLTFYDILFIDKQGRVFYSLRREMSCGQNIFEGSMSQTPLARCLLDNPREETFVDFHYHGISDEPAAFFVEPVYKDGKHLGWIALQCAINKINSLFDGIEQLGETGETFLVNQEGYMLTESSFQGDSTILNKKLSQENIKAKFQEKEGHRTVTDYRGFISLTSFEVVEFMGTQWLVVAKVDKSQITSKHFIQHREYYVDRILHHLASLPVNESKTPSRFNDQKIIRVDMDEFVRANHGELLKTLGVSTCTALIATYPGKFGYLAHVSPLDRVYGSEGTNVLGHVTKKIKTYDIYKYERRRVSFVIVANHFNSLAKIMNKLVDEGFLLSQISVMYHPQAACANVTYDYSQDRICVEWILNQETSKKCIHHGEDAHNLETIVKQFMGEHVVRQKTAT